MNRIDRGLLLAVLFLVGLGLVQVYSSSFIFATESYGNGLHFFIKQLIYAALGLGCLFAFAWMPWKWGWRIGIALWLVSLVGLAMTFIPALTIKAGGAHRWIKLPLGQRFEPAELFKASFPFILAALFVGANKIRGLWPRIGAHLLILSPFLGLLKQPDFGTFVIAGLVGLSILFVFGLRLRYLIAGVVMAVPAFYFLVINVPYRYARIKTYLDPWSDPADRGFQIIQSMLSFHSGGVTGSGLGQGQGKLFFLPEAHTDFTLAVLGEEIGFIGFFFVMMLYGFLVFRGLQITSRVKQDQMRAVALGLTVLFGLSVFINVGVVLGLLPTKGLTLPFLSYGGSSLISTCMIFGWLLNIQRQTEAHSLRKPVLHWVKTKN